jgi:hypothetical protein
MPVQVWRDPRRECVKSNLPWNPERSGTMKRTLLLSAAIVLFALVFFVGLCVAGESVTKPVKIMWTGTVYLVSVDAPTCSGEKYQYINTAKGVSTIFGEADYLSGYCGHVDVDSQNNVIFSGDGWGIVTAANGDQAHLLIHIVVNLTTHAFAQTEEFIGGTGRFEGVSGLTSSTGTSADAPDTFPYGFGVFDIPGTWQATTTGSITFGE